MYQVVVDSQAKKYLDKLPRPEREKIITKLRFVAADPFGPLPDATSLKGEKSTFRFRVGNIRIVYDLDTANKRVVVWKIRPRGEVYKP